VVGQVAASITRASETERLVVGPSSRICAATTLAIAPTTIATVAHGRNRICITTTRSSPAAAASSSLTLLCAVPTVAAAGGAGAAASAR